MRLKKEIQRFPSDEIDEAIDDFNKFLAKEDTIGDSLRFTTKSKTFGSLSKSPPSLNSLFRTK